MSRERVQRPGGGDKRGAHAVHTDRTDVGGSSACVIRLQLPTFITHTVRIYLYNTRCCCYYIYIYIYVCIWTRATRTRTRTNKHTRDVLNATRSRRMRFVTDTVVVCVRVCVRRGMDWAPPPPRARRRSDVWRRYGARACARTHDSRWWMGAGRVAVGRVVVCATVGRGGGAGRRERTEKKNNNNNTDNNNKNTGPDVFGERGPYRNAAHRCMILHNNIII